MKDERLQVIDLYDRPIDEIVPCECYRKNKKVCHYSARGNYINFFRLNKTIILPEYTLPTAKETKYCIDHLELPDKDDRHVLAAAIKTNANLIVTNNIKDFPEEYLQSFGLNAKTADDFLTDIIDLNQEQAVAAFKEMVLNKKNPKQDEFEVLNLLRNTGLKDTANYLHALL